MQCRQSGRSGRRERVARAGGARGLREWAQAVKGEKGEGSSTQDHYVHTLLPPSPPACATPLSGALSVCGSGTSMSVSAQTNNNKDMGGRGYFPPGLRFGGRT